MLHAFEILDPLAQALILVMFALLIGGFALVLHQWSWNQGYKAAKNLVRQGRQQQQAADTQENVYRRIKNALEPLGKKEEEQRGIEVIPLGNHLQKDIYTVNVFWKNEHHGMAILGIQVYSNMIHVESFGALCPQGAPRNYQTPDIKPETAEAVISDVKTFIAETYAMAYQGARAGAR